MTTLVPRLSFVLAGAICLASFHSANALCPTNATSADFASLIKVRTALTDRQLDAAYLSYFSQPSQDAISPIQSVQRLLCPFKPVPANASDQQLKEVTSIVASFFVASPLQDWSDATNAAYQVALVQKDPNFLIALRQSIAEAQSNLPKNMPENERASLSNALAEAFAIVSKTEAIAQQNSASLSLSSQDAALLFPPDDNR